MELGQGPGKSELCYIVNVIWKSDLFDIHSIKQSREDIENGHKWSW